MFRKGIIFGTNIPNIKCHQIINLYNVLIVSFLFVLRENYSLKKDRSVAEGY